MVIVTTSFTGSYRLFYWDALNFDGSDASLQQGEVRSITVSNPGKFEAEMTAIAERYGCSVWWEEIWSISLSRRSIDHIRMDPNALFEKDKDYKKLTRFNK